MVTSKTCPRIFIPGSPCGPGGPGSPSQEVKNNDVVMMLKSKNAFFMVISGLKVSKSLTKQAIVGLFRVVKETKVVPL